MNNNDDLERQKLLYVELPALLHKILCLSQIPLPASKDIVESDIKEIKKITNAECEFVLAHFIVD